MGTKNVQHPVVRPRHFSTSCQVWFDIGTARDASRHSLGLFFLPTSGHPPIWFENHAPRKSVTNIGQISDNTLLQDALPSVEQQETKSLFAVEQYEHWKAELDRAGRQ